MSLHAAEIEALVAFALERTRAAGADQADVVLTIGDSREARVRGDEIDFVKQSRDRTLGLRALVAPAGGGGLATAVTSTSDLDRDAVARLAEETVALARATAPDPAAGLPETGFATDLPDLELLDEGDRDVHVEARIEDARRAEAAARAVDDRIVNSEGSEVSSDFARIAYGSSRGFFGQYPAAHHALFSEPLAAQGEEMQRDYWMTVARRLDALEDAAAVGRQAAERALRRLGARPVATCEAPVVFDAVTAASLLGNLVAVTSGYAVFRESSFLAGSMGEKIASDLVTVIDDGRVAGGLGSKPFDGEGLPTRRKAVVERGVLSTWLLDSYAARKLGLESTGNATLSPGNAPTVGAGNLWLEPGSESLDEIVARTERGLLVTELMGMGFHPATGDYSCGAGGLWIEGGEIRHPVQEVTIAGHLGDMLQSVDAVASELLWRGRIAAPALRIAQMTIGGA